MRKLIDYQKRVQAWPCYDSVSHYFVNLWTLCILAVILLTEETMEGVYF